MPTRILFVMATALATSGLTGRYSPPLLADEARVSPPPSTIRVGMNFVTEPVSIDFLNILDFKVHFMEPWEMTAPTSRFLTDGAFQGMTEREVQDRILAGVRTKFYEVPAPPGYELNVDIVFGAVSGPDSVNVGLGQYNFNSARGDHWFGNAELFEALDDPTGATMAAVALDEIATLPGPFDTPEKAFNAIVHVAAHEIGHLYGLHHVCASEQCTDCTNGCAIAESPYDLMATGPSGIPPDGWLQDNHFTTVKMTQAGGLSSVDLLVKNAGLRLVGDTDLDGDVDVSDLVQLTQKWTGALAYNAGDRLWADGDLDHDQDVDSADINRLVQHWTGAAAGATFADVGTASLAYDPQTGNVRIEASEGAAIASFVLSASAPTFDVDRAELPWPIASAWSDLDAWQIGQTQLDSTLARAEFDLGAILPPGLTEAELRELVPHAAYAWPGGGGGNLSVVVVPEPAAVLLGLGLLTLPVIRSARRRSREPRGLPRVS